MEQGYVLHRRRFRETSLIVELLTAGQGRIAAVARGALRRKSSMAGVLQPLIPLRLTTRGRSELLTLVHAEAEGCAAPIAGARLYAVLYVNELIMKMTVAHDPVPDLFELYRTTLGALAGETLLEPPLRRFECEFLNLIGLGLNLDYDVDSGAALEASREYDYVADRGPLISGVEKHGMRVHGECLLALAGTVAFSERSAREAKHLMRYVLNHHLEGRQLASRELFAASMPRKS